MLTNIYTSRDACRLRCLFNRPLQSVRMLILN